MFAVQVSASKTILMQKTGNKKNIKILSIEYHYGPNLFSILGKDETLQIDSGKMHQLEDPIILTPCCKPFKPCLMDMQQAESTWIPRLRVQ